MRPNQIVSGNKTGLHDRESPIKKAIERKNEFLSLKKKEEKSRKVNKEDKQELFHPPI